MVAVGAIVSILTIVQMVAMGTTVPMVAVGTIVAVVAPVVYKFLFTVIHETHLFLSFTIFQFTLSDYAEENAWKTCFPEMHKSYYNTHNL